MLSYEDLAPFFTLSLGNLISSPGSAALKDGAVGFSVICGKNLNFPEELGRM
jgi:hypothetical protein